jgi:ribulose-bisphosphate carboxylase small chain
MTIQAFRSRVDDPASRKFGTFSYLPALGREEITRQVEYALAQDWTCSVEHVEPARAAKTYWYLWKLPLFGALTADDVMAEVDACAEANPGDLVRLVAYDRRRQTQGLAIVVHRGGAAATVDGGEAG